MRSFIIGLCLISNCLVSWGQGYKIVGSIKGATPQPYMIAHYFGAKQYIIKDTATSQNDGTFVFEGTKPLDGGVYILLDAKRKRLAELIVGNEQNFSFATDTAQIVGNMQIKGSTDNQLFYQHQKQLQNFRQTLSSMQGQSKPDADEQKAGQEKIQRLQQDFDNQTKKIIQQNPTTLTAKILKANLPVELPPLQKDSVLLYQYYKKHFWDNFDFADERLARTPILQNMLDRYISEIAIPHPDSIIKATDLLIDKVVAGKQKEILAYTIWYLTQKAEVASILGGEAVFVHMAEKYYLGGIMPITNQATLTNIQEKVNILKPLMVGKQMPSFSFSDTARVAQSLENIKAKYTVLFFYSPDCQHCIEATPVVKSFAKNHKDEVKVYAISVTGSPEAWKNYIKTKDLGTWTHGYDYTFRTNFRKTFDVVSTPMIYVLDENKKIIGRRIEAPYLEDFITYHEQQLGVSK